MTDRHGQPSPDRREAPPDGDVRRAFQFEFSKDVSADSTETNERTMQYDGRITELVVGWPSGTDNGVGVQLRQQHGEKFFPRNSDDEYIGADNFTHPFPLNVAVAEDDVIVAEFKNNDVNNSHFINVVATVAEVL